MSRDTQTSISDAELRLRELLEHAPDAILEMDAAGHIVLANRMAEQWFGYAREELLGQPVDILVPEAVRSGHKEHRAQYVNHPATRPMGSALKLEARRKDGTHFPVEISLSPLLTPQGLHVMAIIRDTTDRTRIEERQRLLEQRFRAMIEGVKDYAIFMLDPDGNVASWNSGAQRIKQYSGEEVIGRHFSIFYPREDQERKPAEELRLARLNGRFEEEGWRVRRDGTRFWANVVITAMHDSTGDLVGFSKITRDLTAQKRSERELRSVQEKYIGELELRNRDAEEANRLKTEFLANMSHELRSPLHTIIGFAELLEEQLEGELNEKQKRFIGHIHRDGMHLLELINDVLDLSKIEAGRVELRLETFPVEELVAEAVGSVQPRAGQKSLEIEMRGSIRANVVADRLRVKQILHNLLTNAIKFTPGGGKITVESSARDGFAEISVSDNGVGIPPDQQDAIFDKFYQVQATSIGRPEGTGLGLAITKRLVEQQGGTIRLRSAPGQGSRFTFTVPLEVQT